MGEGDLVDAPLPAAREGATRLDYQGPPLLQLIGSQAHNLFGCSASCDPCSTNSLRPEPERTKDDLMATPDHWKIRTRAAKRKADSKSPKSPELGFLQGRPMALDSKRFDFRRRAPGGGEVLINGDEAQGTPETPQSELCASMRAMPGSRARRWALGADLGAEQEIEEAAARVLQRAFSRSRQQTSLRLEEQRLMMARVQELMFRGHPLSSPLLNSDGPSVLAALTPVFVVDGASTDDEPNNFVGARPRFRGHTDGSSSSFNSDWSNSVNNSQWSVRNASSRDPGLTPSDAQDAQKLLDAAWDYSLPEVSPDVAAPELRQPFGEVTSLLRNNKSPFASEANTWGKTEIKRTVSDPPKKNNPFQAEKRTASSQSIFSVRTRSVTPPKPAKDEQNRSILSRAAHKVVKRISSIR